jgi:glycerol-3-phosphate acyltransferase PlsY
MHHALSFCLLAFVFGYLCGSIPFGILLTRLAGGPDLRSIGSGNIGATNVLRTGRKGFAVLLTRYLLGDDVAIAAAVGAFLGHLFPVWLRFRGGKGVATYIGVLLGIAWPAAVVFCAAWLAVAAATRYSSLAALTASLAAPAFLWWWGNVADARAFLLLSILLWIMHRANIGRLLHGTEGRIGARPTSAGAS